MRALRPPIVNGRWLVWRYYLSMLAVAGIDLCFAVIYEIPLIRFMPTELILVAFTIGGAFFIFQPIQRYLLTLPEHRFPCDELRPWATCVQPIWRPFSAYWRSESF